MKWLNQSSLHEEFIFENPYPDLYDKCYFFTSKKKYPKVFTMTGMYKFYTHTTSKLVQLFNKQKQLF